MLSREMGPTFASIVCKTPHQQHTEMIQVGRHGAQLVESIAIIRYDVSMFQIKETFYKTKNSVSISPE